MTKLFTASSRLLAASSLALFCGALYSTWAVRAIDPQDGGVSLSLVQRDVALGRMVIGRGLPFTLTAVNSSTRPARVFAIRDSGCGPTGCRFPDPNAITIPADQFPLAIPPGASCHFTFEALGKESGQFERTLIFYTNSLHDPDIGVRVHGQVGGGAERTGSTADAG